MCSYYRGSFVFGILNSDMGMLLFKICTIQIVISAVWIWYGGCVEHAPCSYKRNARQVFRRFGAEGTICPLLTNPIYHFALLQFAWGVNKCHAKWHDCSHDRLTIVLYASQAQIKIKKMLPPQTMKQKVDKDGQVDDLHFEFPMLVEERTFFS